MALPLVWSVAFVAPPWAPRVPPLPRANERLDTFTFDFNNNIVNSVKAVLDARYPSDATLNATHYARFYVLETVARVPYFAFLSVLHLRETLGERGLQSRMRAHFAEADNELNHLLIMEHLGGNGAPEDRLVAQLLAFCFYWYVVVMFIVSEKAAYHLLELIEEHAYQTYDSFLRSHEEELHQAPVPPSARIYYESDSPHLMSMFGDGNSFISQMCGNSSGVTPGRLQSLYDVFVRIRDDEAEHHQTLCSLVQCGSRLQQECAIARGYIDPNLSDDEFCSVDRPSFEPTRPRRSGQVGAI
jgi:ubiquinol oxidase